MVIITQNKQALWNFDDISRIHVTGNGTGLQAVGRNGAGGEIAKYKSREQCTFVLGMLESAIAAEERTFAFPTIESIQHNTIHRSSGGGSRHGGS